MQHACIVNFTLKKLVAGCCHCRGTRNSQ